jgi:hypothetical protein
VEDGNLEQGKPAAGRLVSAFRRLIWLDERLISARRSAAIAPGKPGWAEYRLARSALGSADALRISGGPANPSALLYRAAILLLIGARAAVATSGSLPDSGQLTAVLGEDGEGVLARLGPTESRETALALRRLALDLLAPLAREAAAVRRVQLARWSRLAAIALLLVGGVAAALYRPNLALGRVVVVAPADAGYPDPSHLVDGKTRNLGFHSSGAPPHIVTLDLGAQRAVSKVVVYNREACCQERAVPLRIELGDGSIFTKVAERESVFNIWRASFPVKRCRFVRLISKNAAPFHLSEVEVY